MKFKHVLIIPSILATSHFGLTQFAPDYTTNYHTQIDYWDNYYATVQADSIAAGNYSMQGTGYSGYQRWKSVWDLYVPASGDFGEAFDIRQDAMNQLKFDHFKSYQAPGATSTNSNIVAPTTWDEIGPFNFSKIDGKYGGVWFNPHLNNDGSKKFAGHVAKVDRIYQHPTESDKFYACVGGIERGGGGLFVKDGTSDWEVLGTDLLPNPKIASLAIKPMGAMPDPTVEYLFIALSTGAVYRGIDDGVNDIFWLECGYNGNVPYPYVSNGGINLSSSLPFSHDYGNPPGNNHEKIGKIEFAKKNASSLEYSRLIVARLGGVYFSDNFNASLTPNLNNYTLNNNIIWTKFSGLDALENTIPDVASTSLINHKEYWYSDFESYEKNGVTTYITVVNVVERATVQK